MLQGIGFLFARKGLIFMKMQDIGMLFLLAALWGASFIFIRVASPVLGPLVLMDLRVLLAALALVIYAVALRKLPNVRTQWKQFLLLGALNAAIPFTLIAVAELYLTASFAAILNATTPMLTAIVAAVWGNEKFTARKAFGLVLGIAGVSVVVGWNPIAMSTAVLIGALCSVGAALFYGIGSVYTTRTFKGVPPMAMAIGQQLGAGVVLLPFAAFQLPPALPSMPVTLCVLALAVLCTSLGYLLYFRLINSVGATRTVTVTFLVPFFGIIWGSLFLTEPIGIGTILGLCIILTSIVFVNGIQFGKSKAQA
jgi:drug/metabolite transporter (DMT)-like permease